MESLRGQACGSLKVFDLGDEMEALGDELEDLGDEAPDKLTAASEPTDAVLAGRAAEQPADYGVADRTSAPAGLVTGLQVHQLLARIEVQRKPDGGITIDAPPEAAETLAAMFAGMASLISQAATPPANDT